MTWRDNLQTADFRGVQFETKILSVTGGKKGKAHDRPRRDGGSSSDLGNKMRKFRVQAFIGGDDYIDLRDNLIDVLREDGPGEFLHPTMGILNVLPRSYTLSESVDEDGGFVRFTIDFEEQNIPNEPQIVESITATTLEDIDKSVVTASESFAEVFDAPDSATQIEALKDVNTTVDVIETSFLEDINSAVQAKFNSLKAVIRNTTGALLLTDVETLMKNVQDLINLPGTVAQEFNNLKDRYEGFVDDILNLFPANGVTKDIRKNQCSMAEVVAMGGIVALARTANTNTFTNRSDILSAVDSLEAIYDSYIARMNEYMGLFSGEVSKDRYEADSAVLDLLASIIAGSISSLTQKAFLLAVERKITLTSDRTVLDLAFELYGDIDKVDELIDINQLNDPTLLVKGTEITYYA